MTQRIFDVENEKDMADLWDILPENIYKLIKDEYQASFCDENGKCIFTVPYSLIKINWHNKTEIIRPIQEATEADVGKLCAFWDSEYNPNAKIVGCLCAILPFKNVKYTARGGLNYKHCRRLTKTEVSELC